MKSFSNLQKRRSAKLPLKSNTPTLMLHHKETEQNDWAVVREDLFVNHPLPPSCPWLWVGKGCLKSPVRPPGVEVTVDSVLKRLWIQLPGIRFWFYHSLALWLWTSFLIPLNLWNKIIHSLVWLCGLCGPCQGDTSAKQRGILQAHITSAPDGLLEHPQCRLLTPRPAPPQLVYACFTHQSAPCPGYPENTQLITLSAPFALPEQPLGWIPPHPGLHPL